MNQGLGMQGWGRRRGWGRGRGGPPWMYGGPPQPPGVATQQPIPPPPPGGLRVAAATLDPNGLDAQVSQVFARAPYIILIDIVDGKTVNVYPIPNPYAYGAGGAGVGIANWLLSSGARVVIASILGPNAESILTSGGVRIIYAAPGSRLIDVLRMNGLVS